MQQSWFRGIGMRAIPMLILLLTSTVVLGVTAWQRGAEYDEGYTVFVTAGIPRPVWPTASFRAADMRGFASGHSSAGRIAADLRTTDVHPPLYFWTAAAWRAVVGPGLLALRLLSVLYGVAALALVASIARFAGIAPALALLLTLGCYGFSYTSVVARGFALAQLLTLAGVALAMLAERWRTPRAAAWALAAGFMLGLATFTNYLAAFVGVAALLWLLLRRWRTVSVWLAAGIGFAAVLPADLWFFLAQRGSRAGQFPPFRWLPSLERLGQYAAGDVFGGLPLYVTGPMRLVLGVALAALLVALAVLVALRWRRFGVPAARWLFAMAAVAPPVGLILLGIMFDNTPIELRYLAFAAPFWALLTAGALASLPATVRTASCALVFAVQAVAIAGLIVMPQTTQPQAATTRVAAALAGPDGLVLVPRGNDGVGVVEAVVQSAPDWLHLMVVPLGASPTQLRDRATGFPVVVVAKLGLDHDSRATLPAMLAAFADQPCWQAGVDDAAVASFLHSSACAPAAAR